MVRDHVPAGRRASHSGCGMRCPGRNRIGKALKLNYLGVASAMVLASAVGYGCGDDDATTAAGAGNSSNTGGDASGGNTTSAGGTSTTTTSTTGGAGGTTGTGGGGALATCAEYCTELQASCTGSNAQFASEQNCLDTCALYPMGDAGDTAGHSRACRAYHGGLASVDAAGADEHCSHAGPHGGIADDAHCQDAGTAQCDVFCAIALQACPGKFNDDLGGCVTECEGWNGFATIDTDYVAPNSASGTMSCRLYHLTAATSDAVPHCNHIEAGAGLCN